MTDRLRRMLTEMKAVPPNPPPLPSQRPHVARIDFAVFYADAAGGLDDARRLLEHVEGNDEGGRRAARVALHQAARMVWLADRIGEVALGRPALNILFYIIAAEAVSKLLAGYTGDFESKKYAMRFFEEHITDAHRA